MPAALIAAAQRPGTWRLAQLVPGALAQLASTSWAAAITAAPTPIVDEDPNVGPASGNSVSPISQLTTPGSSPSTPHAIWVRIVAIPCADVLGARQDHRPSVGVQAHVRAGREANRAHRAVGHPLAHQPWAVALGLARTSAPSERARPLLVALAQFLR